MPSVSIHLLTYFVAVLLVFVEEDVLVLVDFAFALVLVVVAILYNKKICNDICPTIIKVIANATKKKMIQLTTVK
jgi:hypothetical protein